MEEKLLRASAGYTACGLLGGFYYRQLTRVYKFDRAYPTFLRLFHTHALSMGSMFLLIVLALEKSYKLSAQKDYKKFYVPYQIGLGLTLTMMLVKGTMTVIGKEAQESPAFAWLSGLGHTVFAVGMFYFYKVTASAIRDNKGGEQSKK